MGSLPQLSILKGPHKDLSRQKLYRIFESNLVTCENEIALSFIKDIGLEPKNTDFITLNHRSNQIARLLLQKANKHNLKPNRDGDWIISVCMHPNDDLVTILLAIWKAGAAYLPIDPTFPPNRVKHILTEAEPLLTIYDVDVNTEQFESSQIISTEKCLSDSIQFSGENISSSEMMGSMENDLAIVLYTSGSTGVPKGVRLPHAVILNRLQWQWNCFPYSPTEKTGCFKTALTFVDSVSEIWGPLLNGIRLIIIPKEVTKDPEQLIYILEEYDIERLVLVPTLLRNILMYLSVSGQQNVLKKLKHWICSGEPLALSLAKQFYEYFEEEKHCLYNFYGSTEVMGDVTYFACESKKQLDSLQRIPIGQPVDNTIVYLLDDNLRPVTSGNIGEIYVSGLNLADGYVNGRDTHRFLKNPLAIDSDFSRIYRTGDFGSISKTMIMFEGRTDSQIKIRGHRVDLSEVEKVLLTLDLLDKVVVLCYNPGEIDQALLAFVTLRNGSRDYSSKDIQLQLRDKLADYMTPRIIVMDSIPLLVNGKVDRQYLLKTYAEPERKCSCMNSDSKRGPIDFNYSGVPKNLLPIAKDLFEIISEVIGKPVETELSISSNFYDIGGNSLNSIYTVTRLREFGYFLSITDFIKAKNFGEVLQKLSETEIILTDENHGSYLQMHATPLAHDDLEITIDIITSSFYGKADLERWLKADIKPEDYAEIIKEIWDPLVEKRLSFIVRDNTDRPLGVALNFDARDEPLVTAESKLEVIFEFLEHLEGPIRDTQLPPGMNRILHSFMMGTIEELGPQENVAVINFMEDQVVDLAKKKNFAGIFTTNTNPLTQQLGTDVYNYEILLDYQVNRYIHTDGSRPFALAPDSQRAIVHWKDVEKE